LAVCANDEVIKVAANKSIVTAFMRIKLKCLKGINNPLLGVEKYLALAISCNVYAKRTNHGHGKKSPARRYPQFQA
jgi:hypothetical protein